MRKSEFELDSLQQGQSKIDLKPQRSRMDKQRPRWDVVLTIPRKQANQRSELRTHLTEIEQIYSSCSSKRVAACYRGLSEDVRGIFPVKKDFWKWKESKKEN
jgi:thymidylate kinase